MSRDKGKIASKLLAGLLLLLAFGIVLFPDWFVQWGIWAKLGGLVAVLCLSLFVGKESTDSNSPGDSE